MSNEHGTQQRQWRIQHRDATSGKWVNGCRPLDREHAAELLAQIERQAMEAGESPETLTYRIVSRLVIRTAWEAV